MFNLFAAHKVLVLAAGITFLVNHYAVANPAPGDKVGTEQMFAQYEKETLAENPGLAQQVGELREEFETFTLMPTDEQIDTYVLRKTDSCTELRARKLTGPDRKEAAWLLYLDRYGREGPDIAKQFFVAYLPPSKK